jgi:hypothetical protein
MRKLINAKAVSRFITGNKDKIRHDSILGTRIMTELSSPVQIILERFKEEYDKTNKKRKL